MKLAVIGAGNMAGAIVTGVVKSGKISAENICVSDVSKTAAEMLRKKTGVRIASSNNECAAFGGVILIAVKPGVISEAAKSISAENIENKLVISIAAGISAKQLEKYFAGARIVRVMPNTPAMAKAGMTAVCKTENDGDIETAESIFSCVGKTIVTEEKFIDAVTAVSGSGPAYIYMIIEALADGGVLCGLPREVAYTLAAQTVLGSAQMVMSTGRHPGELKDMVCSPAGTTIEAVKTLEQKGLRGAIIEAVEKCAEKSASMSNMLH